MFVTLSSFFHSSQSSNLSIMVLMDLELKNKVAVITGGAQGIGKCIAEEFEKEGAKVAIIDIKENDYFVGDLADKDDLEKFADKVIKDFGKVDFLINNAAPVMCGIESGTYEDFEYALKVGVTAPFYLSKLFMPHFTCGASIVNISSSRDRMSQPQTESYTAAKGGISSDLIAFARERKVPEDVISDGRTRIVEIMADALREGMTWAELIRGVKLSASAAADNPS